MQNEKKQNRIFIAGFSLIVIVVLWFLVKPFLGRLKNNQGNLNEEKLNMEILKAPSVVPEELFQKIEGDSKAFVVDISSPDDFNRGHIARSINASENEVVKNFLESIGADSTADIYIINNDGNLEGLAAMVNRVVSEGFVNTKYLRGGIDGWKEKGYPLISSGGSEADNAKVKKITIDEIRNDAENKAAIFQFVDVRDQDDFSKEHIIGAINIPLSDLEARDDVISSVNTVIVYGSDKNESFQAAVSLFDLNFFNVYQMQGTIDDWKAAGGNTK